MEKYIKQSELKRNLTTLVEGIKISIKEALEYKINFIFLLWLTVLGTSLTVYTFTYFLDSIILDLLNWQIKEIILFSLLNSFFLRFFYFFGALDLTQHLLKGNLNNGLSRPTNIFVFQNILMIHPHDIVIILILLIPILLLIFINYSFSYLFFLLFLLMPLYQQILVQFFGSFSFMSKRMSEIFHNFNREIYGLVRNLTPKFLEKSIFKNIIFILPQSLMGFGLIELLLGKSYILIYFKYSLVVMFVLILITYLNWKIGLKKYEAFG